jgi:hypothetical protein
MFPPFSPACDFAEESGTSQLGEDRFSLPRRDLKKLDMEVFAADGVFLAFCARLSGLWWLGCPAPLACNGPGTYEPA